MSLKKTFPIHEALLIAIKFLHTQKGYEFTTPEQETESAEYAAYTLTMGERKSKFRMAKITPTKTGQFVTLWKRNGNGPITPFDLSDNIQFFIISVSNSVRKGLFVFSSELLNEKGIVSGNNKAGKRAMRIYPPWDITTSKQAQNSQAWQLDHFHEISYQAL